MVKSRIRMKIYRIIWICFLIAINCFTLVRAEPMEIFLSELEMSSDINQSLQASAFIEEQRISQGEEIEVTTYIKSYDPGKNNYSFELSASEYFHIEEVEWPRGSYGKEKEDKRLSWFSELRTRQQDKIILSLLYEGEEEFIIRDTKNYISHENKTTKLLTYMESMAIVPFSMMTVTKHVVMKEDEYAEITIYVENKGDSPIKDIRLEDAALEKGTIDDFAIIRDDKHRVRIEELEPQEVFSVRILQYSPQKNQTQPARLYGVSREDYVSNVVVEYDKEQTENIITRMLRTILVMTLLVLMIIYLKEVNKVKNKNEKGVKDAFIISFLNIKRELHHTAIILWTSAKNFIRDSYNKILNYVKDITQVKDREKNRQKDK